MLAAAAHARGRAGSSAGDSRQTGHARALAVPRRCVDGPPAEVWDDATGRQSAVRNPYFESLRSTS